MKIKNFTELATTPQRNDALSILEKGLQAIDTEAVITRCVSLSQHVLTLAGVPYDTTAFDRVRLVGVGKCSADAACVIAGILGNVLESGVVIDTQECALPKGNIQFLVGTHPLPEEQNVVATRALCAFLADSTEKDLVIAIISGGGSTLLCQPEDGFTCADESLIVSSLMSAGATIQEENIVRKHLSKARGGGLAQAAYPATLVSLIFSDVPGDDIEFIASGPTVADVTTVADAQAILARYGIGERAGFLIETPKEKKFFEHTTNTVVVSNTDALTAMQDEARTRGYDTRIVTTTLSGEARDVARDVLSQLHVVREKTALLFGGETTVSSGDAHNPGGRNQEVALAGFSDVRDTELLTACASDGRDNTDVAGALCDTALLAAAQEQNCASEEYLARHDSYAFFKNAGGHIITGDTGSNVSDLICAIK
jgi:glycerate-2-kinase